MQPIKDQSFGVLGYALKQLFHRIEVRCSPVRPGGYFCLAYGDSGTPMLIAEVGEPPAEAREQKLSFCQEKARRLASHPEHLSSWQSKNETLNQYAGAIRTEARMLMGEKKVPIILSFSGLPQLADEVLMLSLAVSLGLMGLDQAVTIARFSDNSGNLLSFLDPKQEDEIFH